MRAKEGKKRIKKGIQKINAKKTSSKKQDAKQT